jgi:hypothetical protein
VYVERHQHPDAFPNTVIEHDLKEKEKLDNSATKSAIKISSLYFCIKGNDGGKSMLGRFCGNQ